MRAGRRAAVTAALVAMAAGGCGGGMQAFALSAKDNDPAQLQSVLQRTGASRENRPMGADGRPAVYVAAGTKKPNALVRFDLEDGSKRWDVEAQLASKVVVGADFVAYADGEGRLVGLDSGTGTRRFAGALGEGRVRGVAADARRAFAVVERGPKDFEIVSFDGTTGEALWTARAPGELGAPAARNGVVLVPYLKQWVVVLDAATGGQLARLRSDDEEVAFVRTTPTATYFGSKGGAFLLDDKAAAGTKKGATYGEATMPAEFVRSFYHFDAFDPVQVSYSAYDRNRLLWRGSAAADGGFQFADDTVVVHSYKFFFGFEAATGELAWAVSLPRADAVASSHLGSVIAYVTGTGGVGALAPATGEGKYSGELDVGDRTVLGATFDADGWNPAGSEPVATARALAAIVRDRDARFTDVKLFAVSALASRDEPDVTGELLAIALEPSTPPRVYDKAVQVLVARKQTSGVPALLDALEVTFDYIENRRPRAVDVIARALGAMGDLREEPGVSDADKARLVDRLVAHLFDPQTEPAVSLEIVGALGAVGLPAAMAPLRRYLLLYRADPSFARQMAAVGATIDALVSGGGEAELAAVAFVADDPATEPGIAEYATRALRERQRPRAAR